MTAVSVTTSSTQILAPSQATRWAVIENNSSVQAVYLCFDGPTATLADGLPLAANGTLVLVLAGQVNKGIYGIVASATADVRIQAG